MNILVVEDDTNIASLVSGQLLTAGFIPHRAGSLSDARDAIQNKLFPLVLIDRRLPDGDGLHLVADARARQPGVRVIMLTALDATAEKIEGLNAGADDYLSKPFEPDELMARIRACLRRPGGENPPPVKCGAMSFDFSTRTALVREEPLLLPGLELTLLETLLRHVRRTTPRRQLMKDVYGAASSTLQSNVLDVLVSRLRRHLLECNAGVAIHPVRGVGYILTEGDR
ncbi:response regulator transcription factor [Methylocystis bryophila]|uniref:Two-component system response regulator n=1 Tax=Methylocystis bryophila TaxID=655015 RepID=A0A1W6MTX0_9HYPH|nr:response regulator transcription factor [Methylocystis bryophila]ARN81063.1 two-component system response regulator [Methylocystis bryophila]BDV36986.1 DNA-binding response regulator [Methylocystis bryophila]